MNSCEIIKMGMDSTQVNAMKEQSCYLSWQ